MREHMQPELPHSVSCFSRKMILALLSVKPCRLTGSDDGRHSNTSLAWGAGVQFNPTESVAIDIAYEGSGSGDWRTDGFIVGVGYKF